MPSTLLSVWEGQRCQKWDVLFNYKTVLISNILLNTEVEIYSKTEIVIMFTMGPIHNAVDV